MGCRGCTAILPSPSDECPQPLFISDPLTMGPSSPPAPLCSSQPGVQKWDPPSTLQPAPAPGQCGFISPATVPGGTVPHRGSPAVPPTRAADGAIGAAPGHPPASPLPSVSLFPTASILVGTGVKNNAALPHGLRGSSQVAITTRGRRACQHRGHRLHRDAAARARRTGREGTAASPSVPGGPALCPPWSRARASCQDPAPNLASFSCTEVLARGFNIQVSLLRCPQLPGGSVPVTDAPARLLSSLLLAFSISHSPCKSCRRSISAIRQWQKCSRQEHGAPRPHAAAAASPCRWGRRQRGEGKRGRTGEVPAPLLPVLVPSPNFILHPWGSC